MEVTELIHGEQIFERASRGLENCVFDGCEFRRDKLRIHRVVAQSGQNISCIVLVAAEKQPARGLWKRQDKR
jgi:hypothetical protein